MRLDVYMKTLRCTTGGHNKFYETRAEYIGGEYIGYTRYGPIGKSGRETEVVRGTINNVLAALGKVENAKLAGKGASCYSLHDVYYHEKFNSIINGEAPDFVNDNKTANQQLPNTPPSTRNTLNWEAAGPRITWG